MYVLIEFDDDVVEIVPVGWIEHEENISVGQNVQVAFPPKGTVNVRKVVREKSPSQTTWPSFAANILYAHGRQ